jgi:hypothetical protein
MKLPGELSKDRALLKYAILGFLILLSGPGMLVIAKRSMFDEKQY